MNRLIYIIMLLSLCSCVKGLDFDQADILTLNPVIESSIIYFNEPANTFFVDTNGEEISLTQDETILDIFKDSFVTDNLEKAVFVFEMTNTINRNVVAQIDFLNLNEDILHTFTINASTSINNEEVITTHIELFQDDTLLALKATEKMVFTIILPPSIDGTLINENTEGRMELKSKATFFLNINTAE